ncbi:hypothetical protein M4D81_05570 [Paenibacillus sp. p3-SID867]|uniref:hypothetical protein n=1 Tax=Paenibacillus sp. p3-SID867 TaxID=2916363 RepID=UPI0021A63B4C|nr:hypothetical protein [Paenibacillus sp. p3-SID867]MCT1398472.1 hypothetical protein [Paenibacillus sp. p3-SID867]
MKSMVTSDANLNAHLSSFQHKKEAGRFYQDMIVLHVNCSQEYMKLSMHFLDRKLLYVSLLLCNRALKSMLIALYIKEEGRQPMSDILLEDILRMFPEGSGMNAESLIFIQSLSFLSQESSLISKMKPTHLMNLIKRADELLLQISSLLELPYQSYHSVFKM